jgi:hypothetical protein
MNADKPKHAACADRRVSAFIGGNSICLEEQ